MSADVFTAGSFWSSQTYQSVSDLVLEGNPPNDLDKSPSTLLPGADLAGPSETSHVNLQLITAFVGLCRLAKRKERGYDANTSAMASDRH